MNEKEIIMNELDTMEDVLVLAPEKKAVNFGKIGLAVLAVGAVAALGYKGYKLIKAKKARKAQGDECASAFDEDFEDNVEAQ